MSERRKSSYNHRNDCAPSGNPRPKRTVKVPRMSASNDTHAWQFPEEHTKDEEGTSSEALPWGQENDSWAKEKPEASSVPLPWGQSPWEETGFPARRPKKAPLIVTGVARPGKFWPDGQEPITHKKMPKRFFKTSGKDHPRIEITGQSAEIGRIKNKPRSSETFTPNTGDVVLYHDYSDYEDPEDALFEDVDILDGVHIHSGKALARFGKQAATNTTLDDDDDHVEVHNGITVLSGKAAALVFQRSPLHPTWFSLLEQSHDPKAATFDKTADEWINKGRRFPPNATATPYALQQLCQAILTVPERMLTLALPPHDISVQELFQFHIAPIDKWQKSQFINFESHLPTDEVFHTKELPRKSDVERLRNDFGQALLDGMCSIRDPRIPDNLYPLWTIEFWWRLHHINDIQGEWVAAREWLQQRMAERVDVEVFYEAEKQLLILPHDKPLHGPAALPGRTTQSLVLFLSDDRWLSDSLIDMMTANLNSRLGMARRHDVTIVSTHFSDTLLLARDISYHNQKYDVLENIKRDVNIKRYLYFPVHLRVSKHYIAFVIDFHNRTFAYGDSLDPKSRPELIINKLQWWFSKRFDGEFKDLGPTLSHGHQVDSSSCGLFAINTIEHHVFGCTLGIPNPASERARWFALTAGAQNRVPPVLPERPMASLLPTQAEGLSDAIRRSEMKQSYLAKQAQRQAERQKLQCVVERLEGGCQKLNEERMERERMEQERLEQERQGQERLEQVRLEQEQVEQARLEKERLEQQSLEQARLEEERLEQARLEQEQVEQARLEQERLEKERLEQERLEQEQQSKVDHEMYDVVMTDDTQGLVYDSDNGMDADLYRIHTVSQGKGKAADTNYHTCTPIAPEARRMRRSSVSPTRYASSSYKDYHSRRPVSPRSLSYRDYCSSQWDCAISHRGRSRSPERSTRRYRSPSPLVSAHPVAGPSTPVLHTVPPIPGPSSYPSQPSPPVNVTPGTGLDQTSPGPAMDTTTTRWIIDRAPFLGLPNNAPTSVSLENPFLQNRLLHLISDPPSHFLHLVARGNSIVSKRTEIRLRLWGNQYPDAPRGFFATRCLSRGIDWQVFVDPHDVTGPRYNLCAPRPAYFDCVYPPLYNNRITSLQIYEDRVRELLLRPYARRFLTMGGIIWRIALHYGPDHLFAAALSGPSTDAYVHGNVERNGTHVDDAVFPQDIQLLLGVAVDMSSLWPPLDIFHRYQKWNGEWTPQWETWFMTRIALIHNRDLSSFAPRSDWNVIYRRHTRVKFILPTTEGTEAQADALCKQLDSMGSSPT
ncbi:hypothetical protein DFJ58DRAFT_912422 [Suillus subalutaceus]|uniref:uncharacterized protein n=1 Tax=Suillus subalutaceus TaxID=48586 RepID=UPI001B85BE7B|nr:uncharacterized protein DFJ58DRAFT_912422 [Suillus subalutaceus]KAG1863253.1 hypothetical protein DFJ58DRAFT_912422 [Suillus subalutaceus]